MTDIDELERLRQAMGSAGLWVSRLTRSETERARGVALAAESIGFGSVWSGEVFSGRDIFDVHDEMVSATSTLVTGTGIANMWVRPPEVAAQRISDLHKRHPGRFIAGFGTSHRELTSLASASPLSTARAYLDRVRAEVTVPVPPLILAALGPRMTELAADIADGVHTYLVTPEHTSLTRSILGKGPLLVPEMAALLGSGEAADARAREHVAPQLSKRNYSLNARRMGLDLDDVDSASRRLVARGGVEGITAAVRAHLDAGADHVAIQLLDADPLDDGARLHEIAVALASPRSSRP